MWLRDTRSSTKANSLPSGARWAPWVSHWQGTGYPLWPGQQQTSVSVAVKKDFFQQEQFVPVNVHVSFALTSYRETNSREVVSQAGKFSVPGVGICWVEGRRQWSGNLIQCHSPSNHRR